MYLVSNFYRKYLVSFSRETITKKKHPVTSCLSKVSLTALIINKLLILQNLYGQKSNYEICVRHVHKNNNLKYYIQNMRLIREVLFKANLYIV